MVLESFGLSNDNFIRIDLLRHGEAEGGTRYRGRTDDPLTAAGEQQMWAAVGDENHWNGIVSSPLIRCADFARTLARRHSLPLRIDTRLREMDFGEWDGRGADDILRTDAAPLQRFWKDPWRHAPPGGESLPQVQARVLEAWRDAAHERRPMLLITHGGPIRLILCQVWGHPIERLLDIEVPLGSLHGATIPTTAALIAAAKPS